MLDSAPIQKCFKVLSGADLTKTNARMEANALTSDDPAIYFKVDFNFTSLQLISLELNDP